MKAFRWGASLVCLLFALLIGTTTSAGATGTRGVESPTVRPTCIPLHTEESGWTLNDPNNITVDSWSCQVALVCSHTGFQKVVVGPHILRFPTKLAEASRLEQTMLNRSRQTVQAVLQNFQCPTDVEPTFTANCKPVSLPWPINKSGYSCSVTVTCTNNPRVNKSLDIGFEEATRAEEAANRARIAAMAIWATGYSGIRCVSSD